MSESNLVSVTGTFAYRLNNKSYSTWYANIIEVSMKNNDVPEEIRDESKKKINVTVTGENLPVNKDIEVKYFGNWVHTKYGVQFKVTYFEEREPETQKARIAYLSSSRFKGIGKKMAEALCKTFGKNVFSVIESEPDKLMIVSGMTKKKQKAIVEGYKMTRVYRKLNEFLLPLGVPGALIIKLAEQMGEDVVDKIKSNPYILCHEGYAGFKMADNVARQLGIKPDFPDRIGRAIIFLLNADSVSYGNMMSDYFKILQQSYLLLNDGFPHEVVSKEAVFEGMKALQQKKDIVARTIDNKTYISTYANDSVEYNSAHLLLDLYENEIDKKFISNIDKSIEEAEKHFAFTPTAEQKKAVKTALSNRVAVITGEAGTGKTSIVLLMIETYRSILKKMHKTECNIVGLAPTGKARSKLQDVTGVECFTIHKRCHILPDVDLEIEPEPLPQNALIIVDEMSMVDSKVFEKMVKLIPSSSRLVMVGDPNQLPSVGAGQVLSDIIKSDTIPVIKLTEVFRQSSKCKTVIENLQKIKNGETDLHFGDDFFLCNAETENEAVEKIVNLYVQEVKEHEIENVQILTPFRRNKKLCSDELNKVIQEYVNPSTQCSKSANINGIEYRVNDRVMQLKNTEVASNGDTGVITSIAKDSETQLVVFTIQFDNGNVERYTEEDMADVTLAYCMTVHKSQGMEYEVCIIPLLSCQAFTYGRPSPLFKRNMIYTAISRTKGKCILISDISSDYRLKAVEQCINTPDMNVRNTSLCKRLVISGKKFSNKYPEKNFRIK